MSLKKEQSSNKKDNLNPNIYIVGTEEGFVHECSKAYTTQYLNTYKAHDMSVYSAKWNNYCNVFLTAGADWTVKVWNQGNKIPCFSFDLGSQIGDIAWAPYSSTVFAAITNIGKIHIYDLNINKNDSLCDQLVVKKAKLTKIKFNPTWPIILVGDDKGLVQTLKLSPNLRKKTKLKDNETFEQSEKNKLNNIIGVTEVVEVIPQVVEVTSITSTQPSTNNEEVNEKVNEEQKENTNTSEEEKK
jgi:dynein intermediate chain 1, axonemal